MFHYSRQFKQNYLFLIFKNINTRNLHSISWIHLWGTAEATLAPKTSKTTQAKQQQQIPKAKPPIQPTNKTNKQMKVTNKQTNKHKTQKQNQWQHLTGSDDFHVKRLRGNRNRNQEKNTHPSR